MAAVERVAALAVTVTAEERERVAETLRAAEELS